ncbi:MAG: hypothetical protein HY975_02890 [Candidatus Kerfeldbacteria bacterium]|nr:hypothetical protein [Candidatus Kerfeldbacteria bacterium]
MTPAWTMVTQAWRWYNDHLRMLLTLSLIAAVPTIVLQLTLVLTHAPLSITNESLGFVISYGVGYALWSIFNYFWVVLGTIAMYQFIREPAGTITAWARFLAARGQLVNYFGTMIVYGLIIMGGTLLLIIPGIIWAVMFSLAPLVAIFENTSISDALKRSRELTRGHWFDVFGRGLLMGLTVVAISILAGLAFGIIGGMFGGAGTVVNEYFDLLGPIINVFLAPAPLIMTYLIYAQLSKQT